MRPKNQQIAIFIAAGMALIHPHLAAQAAGFEFRPVLGETNGVVTVDYRSSDTLVCRASTAAPAGVELLRPGTKPSPVEFRTRTETGGDFELGPAKIGTLSMRLRLEQRTPSLVQRTLEVTAETAQQFAVRFLSTLSRMGSSPRFRVP